MKKTLFSLLVAATVVVFGASAYAATQTASMNVNLNAIAAVSVSATDMNFGNVVVGNDANSTSTITVTAPNGLSYAISLDCGQHYNGLYRCMNSGTDNSIYWLVKPDGINYWGDSDYANTYHGGSSVPGTGTSAAQAYTVNGIAHYPTAPGAYSDVVTVTVNY